jgi:hypothetical protein
MKKIIVVGLAIFAVSTSAALAKGKAKKPAAAPAAAASSAAPILPPASAADMALYKKSQVESGMKKK